MLRGGRDDPDRMAERAEEDRQQRDLEQRRADRVADYTPASESAVKGGNYEIGRTRFLTERGGPGWIARTQAGEWEVGATEAEAIGKLIVSLADVRPGVPIRPEDFESLASERELAAAERVLAALHLKPDDRLRGLAVRFVQATEEPF